jgi:hypothetical protein
MSRKWSDLQERIAASSSRPGVSGQDSQKPRSKRFLNPQDIADIVGYQSGETTQQVGARYGISKSRIATILREQGITIRRQGLNDEHISEAATLYAAGRSLAWMGARYGVSRTTVAATLRRHGKQLRPRPGWGSDCCSVARRGC